MGGLTRPPDDLLKGKWKGEIDCKMLGLTIVYKVKWNWIYIKPLCLRGFKKQLRSAKQLEQGSRRSM